MVGDLSIATPYPGFPAYVDRAAAEFLTPPDPQTLVFARRQPSLSALSSLVSQAHEAPPRDRADIIVHAEAHADALRLASRAADMILAEARLHAGLSAATAQSADPPEEAADPDSSREGPAEASPNPVPRTSSSEPPRGRKDR